MSKQLIVFIIVSFCVISSSWGQHILKGKIEADGEAAPYAKASIAILKKGSVADEEGVFIIENLKAGSYKVKVASVGFLPVEQEVTMGGEDTTFVTFQLDNQIFTTDDVVITGTMKETYIKDSPIKVEVINQQFFKLNPTNNIIEAMEMVNGVQEQINCGVCGTNDIHINGMEGPYTLVMIDGMPIVSALSSVYGFNGIPVSLVERIEIVKGPASSLYGTEAVGGVINIITRKPEDAPRFSMNAFYTSHQEANVDLAARIKASDNVLSLISGNIYRNEFRLDANGDGFTDMPTNERLSLFNRWTFLRKSGQPANLAFRYYRENRFGGVMDWDKTTDIGSDEVYGEYIETRRGEAIGRYGIAAGDGQLRLDYSFNVHRQDSYYGNTRYQADQAIAFTNFIWDKKIKRHDLLLGASLRWQYYDDNTVATTDADRRTIPGIFAQDEWKFSDKGSLLMGMRWDYHKDHGSVVTPRLAFRYKPSGWTTFRINAGQGFRLVNLFTEDHAALTGARQVVIQEELAPEQSYNVNLNFNHVYLLGLKSTGTLDVDAFYTYFSNKIIPNYEVDPDLIVYENLENHAIVRGMAFSFDHRFVFPLTLKLGLTFQDVYEVEIDDEGNQEKIWQVFASRWSGVFVTTYEWKAKKLSFNWTGKLNGPMALPTYEAPFNRAEVSPWFTHQNVQITKKFDKGWDIYGGVKNIWNYTQPSPLINPGDPFSDSFDTAYAYGPLQPRRVFLGFRCAFE